MIFIGVLCAVFGVWGAYDLWVKIPAQERVFERYQTLSSEIQQLEERQASAMRSGRGVAQADLVALDQKKSELASLTPGGAAPTRPSKFNRLTQVIYILCLPCAPYFFWLLAKAKRQSYRLEEDGTLHFTGDPKRGDGAWPPQVIADIDMSKWMRKSIAHVVHIDGSVLKLDAYLYKNLHLIIGMIANRLHPDQWDPEARPVNRDADEQASLADEQPDMAAAREPTA